MLKHALVLPVLLPFAVGALMILVGDRRLGWQRALGLASCVALLLVAIAAVDRTSSGRVDVYPVGGWPAPFGIVLVLDRLAALMLAVTAVVAVAALASVLMAEPGWDTRGRHCHPLFQLQLMGLNGAFITGDLFNLFVFFEVLLVASYGLLAHGRGAERLRAGFHYMVVNLAASALFLMGIALLYALTGTLNLADLAVRVPRVAPDDMPLVRAAAVMLFVVFAVKAAVFPLYLWLPRAYAAAAPPVSALFAVMTKVGVYAMLRVHALIFGVDAEAAGPWLLGAAVATSVLGILGAVAADTLAGMTAYLTLASMGTLLIAVGAFSGAGVSAALYYLVHSTLVIAALFLLAERIGGQRGDDRFRPSAPVAQPAALGALFAIGAASVAGVPPLSGFVGKLMILQSTAATPGRFGLWSVLLGTGLLAMIGLARAGSALFWKTAGARASAARPGLGPLLPTVALLVCGAALAVFAAPVQRFADATAEQLADRHAYATRILRGGNAPTSRPFPPEPRP
jgi:multicomponent K+:H+ antiporter subunit D